MITRSWAFKVYGDPQPKGSMTCIGQRGPKKHNLIEDNDDGPAWREKVAGIARSVVREIAGKWQPIAVEATFTLPRPKSHYGTGRNRHRVLPSAPEFPTPFGTGDEDKLERNVLDALKDAGVLLDDAQVQRIVSEKFYPDGGEPWSDALDRPGVVVRIRPRRSARDGA
jgi:crossover junction endodeoxyribonuclease RusA